MTRTDLYTAGGEFTLPNGESYIGGYHIHVDEGAMVGPFHKSSQHDLLTPVNNRTRLYVRRIQGQLQRSAPITSASSSSARGSGGSGGY
jgi:hypothetical protein